MIDNLWNHLAEQIGIFLQDQIGQDPELSQVLMALEKRHTWTEFQPFKTYKFYYESADMPLVEWLNAIEALVGNEAAERVNDDLRSRLKTAAFETLALRDLTEEMDRTEALVQWKFEHNQEIERRATA